MAVTTTVQPYSLTREQFEKRGVMAPKPMAKAASAPLSKTVAPTLTISNSPSEAIILLEVRGDITKEQADVLRKFGDTIIITTTKNGRNCFSIQIAEGQENRFKKILKGIKDKKTIDYLFSRSITDGTVGFKELETALVVSNLLGKNVPSTKINLQTKASAQGPLRAFMLIEAANKNLDKKDKTQIAGSLSELANTRAVFESTAFVESLFRKGTFMEVFTPDTLGDTLFAIKNLKEQCVISLAKFEEMPVSEREKYKNAIQIIEQYKRIASNIFLAMGLPKNLKMLDTLIKKEKDAKSKAKYEAARGEILKIEKPMVVTPRSRRMSLPVTRSERKTAAEQAGKPHIGGLVKSDQSKVSFETARPSGQPKLGEGISLGDLAKQAAAKRKEMGERKKSQPTFRSH